jgi:glycosyltransferase EpsF
MSEEYPARILHVVGRLARGGAETMIINLYREVDISRIQFDFLVYQESDGSFDDEIIQRGGRILYLDRSNKFNIIQYYCDLKTLVKENGPYQAIHVHTQFHSGFVLLGARFLGVPIRICHAHSTADASSISLIRRLYQSIMRKLIKLNATQLLACGNDAGFFLYGDSFNTKGEVIPNAIDYNQFENVKQDLVNKFMTEFGLEDSGIIIGSVASFREAKNHMFMLDIAEEMKKQSIQFKLVFAGGGSLFNEIKIEVEKRHLSDRVLFLGVRDDVPVLMKAFDVILMPSLYEGLPVTLVETQASNICAVISENITDEVNFDLGLIKKVSLKADKTVWISELLNGAKLKNSVPQQYVKNQLSKNGFLVQDSIKQLYKIYNYKQ